MRNKKEIDKKSEKQLMGYIDKNLSKGYSLKSIREVLVKYGYNKQLTNYLIKTYKSRNKKIGSEKIKLQLSDYKSDVVFLFIVLLIGSGFLLGYDVGQEYGRAIGIIEPETIIQEFDYIDEVSLELSSNYEYMWVVGNPGNLKSISLKGVVSKKGSARVYLEHEDELYLIFDNSRLSEDVEYEAIVMGTQSKARRAIDDIFEFNVVSEFGDIDYNKVCTKFNVNDVNLCYGNNECCAFIELESSGNWDDSFYLSYGRYGSGLLNVVKAQLIYYDVDLSTPYSDIVYSDVYSLDAEFYEEISFSDVCVDTCLLPLFDETSYKLVFEVEDANLSISGIRYIIEEEIIVKGTAPVLVKEIEEIIVYKNEYVEVYLSLYFYDEDSEVLSYSVSDVDDIDVEIVGSTARIIPEQDFTGKKFLYFTASDEYYDVSSNVFVIDVVEKPKQPWEVEVSEELIGPVVFGRNLKWIKKVVASDRVINLGVDITSDAFDVVVSADKINIDDNGVMKSLVAYNAEKRISQIDKSIGELNIRKEELVIESPTAMQEISAINSEILELENERNELEEYVVEGGGGEIITVIIEDIIEKVEIEYWTERADLPKYAPGEIIIKYKEEPKIKKNDVAAVASGKPQIETKFSSVNNLNKKFKVEKSEKLFDKKGKRFENIHKIKIKDKKVEDAVEEYSLDENVEYAEPNYIAYTAFVPNDDLYSGQWAHQITQAELGWDIERGNDSIVIAIIDTGVDYAHEDLAANIHPVMYDFTDTSSSSCHPSEDCTVPDNDPSDYHGHGTHVAGIAAAVSNNSVGIAGVCQNCKIMVVRAGWATTIGEASLEYDDVANAIIYAADNGADVISMSFGGPASITLQNATDYAYNNKSVTLIAAAGNDDTDVESYPAAYGNVIAVAATAQDDSRAYYSNYGSWVDVAAPGGDTTKDSMILSTVPSGYSTKQGTSMAAPYVAGLAGLILSKNSSWVPEEVKQVLKQGVDELNTDEYIGTGRVNLSKALQIDSPPTLIGCADQGGYNCSLDEYCPGTNLTANDTTSCCDVVCEALSCPDQGGDTCASDEYCPGSELTANNTARCCDAGCQSPSWPLCTNCGDGLFNLCDETECELIPDIDSCYYEGSSVCTECASISCTDYDDAGDCNRDMCGIGTCVWAGISCVSFEGDVGSGGDRGVIFSINTLKSSYDLGEQINITD